MGRVTEAPLFGVWAVLEWVAGRVVGVGVLLALASKATVDSSAVSLLWIAVSSFEGVLVAGAWGRMALTRGSLMKV